MTRRLYAHRGATAEEPENTLASFERALSYQVDGLEMDVHMTSDGVIVVAHDPDGQRMCNQRREIKQTPFSELSRWDAGWGFVDVDGRRPFVGRGYKIPRFAEVLTSFPSTLINVDLKQRSPSMVKAVLAIVRQARASHRVTLSSFSQRTLFGIHANRYSGATGLGATELAACLYLPSSIGRRINFRLRAAQIPPTYGPLLLATPEKIATLHRLGARVDFWTINDPEHARELLVMGADGIMTDDPKALMPVFSPAK